MSFKKRLAIFFFILFDAVIISFVAFYFQQQSQLTLQKFNNQSQVFTPPKNVLTNDLNDTALDSSSDDITEETSNETETFDYQIKLLNECDSLTVCQNRLTIEDDPNCKNKVSDALNLLESDSPENYYFAIKYIGSIHCEDKGSGIYVWMDPPEVTIGQSTLDAGDIWLAGVFVHEAKHAELYRQYIKDNPTTQNVPKEVYSGEAAEQKCLDKQYQALVQIGADQGTLDYLKNTINDKYWEVDYEDRWW